MRSVDTPVRLYGEHALISCHHHGKCTRHRTSANREESSHRTPHRTCSTRSAGFTRGQYAPVLLGVQTSSRSRSPRIARLSVTCEKRQLAESMRRARDMRKQERYKDEMARLRANGAKIEIEIEILGRSIE